MTSASTSRDLDVEAQRDVSQPHQLGEDNNHETTDRASEVASDASRVPADLAQAAQPVAAVVEVKGEGVTREIIHQPEREDTRQASTRAEHGEVQPGANTQTRHMEDHNTGGSDPDDFGQEPRMIGDFNGSDNTLWSLYRTEAKNYDEARIQPLKQDMDGVLIFAGLSATALTSFVIESKQNLQADPTDRIVYYLEQHSTILSQISQQIASIAPEVSIPSTPPPPFPPFRPSASDVRINIIWFMALAFSLSAALLAILVQQWVRNYMHVFLRYSDPQKSARLRQFLYDGLERWHMPIAAEAVPGLLHVSLFLFFAGLADSTLNVNTAIGVATTVPIGICGLLYIFTTFAPVIYSQSPYQTSFSGIIWYAVQKWRDWRSKDRDKKSVFVSTNMAQGQMQLSMKETEERRGRDKRAIRWLFDNLTENAEFASFVMAVSGSFNGEWSIDVWTELSKLKEEDMPDAAQPSSRLAIICKFRNVLGSIPRLFRTRNSSRSPTNSIIRGSTLPSNFRRSTVHERERIRKRELCRRIGYLFDTCKDRALISSHELWRSRARACVEAMASLVFNANAELGWFGDSDIPGVLRDIGISEGSQDLSLAGRDQAFVVRWTCLSIMNIRTSLKGPKSALFWPEGYIAQVEKAREIDEALESRWRTEREWGLSSRISLAANIIQKFEDHIRHIIGSNPVNLNEAIDVVSQKIIQQLPGVNFDLPDPERLAEPFLQHTFKLFRDPSKLRFILSCRQSPNKFVDYLKRIDSYRDNSSNSEYELKQVVDKVFWPKHFLQRRLWSIQDLHDSGGAGFAVELFLLSLRQLLSAYSSQESEAPYIVAFKAITSNCRKHGSLGTQKILLDVVASDQGFLRTFDYPAYITDELWKLLGDMLKGQTGRHIDGAVEQLTDLQRDVGGECGGKASELISLLRPPHLQGPSAPTDLE